MVDGSFFMANTTQFMGGSKSIRFNDIWDWYLKNNNMTPFKAQQTDNECIMIFKVAWIGYKMAIIVRRLGAFWCTTRPFGRASTGTKET